MRNFTLTILLIFLNSLIGFRFIRAESLDEDGRTESPDSSSIDFPEDCGRSDIPTFNRLFGARPARLGAWPWMALIGYYNKDNELQSACAGSLISNRVVLTAGDCIWRLSKANITMIVRLGELDYNTTIDGANPIDVPIEATIIHNATMEDQRIGKHDIGLIHLKHPVTFTSHIRPICLPASQTWKEKSYVGAHPHLIGWGRNSYIGEIHSTHLLEVQIEIKENEYCQQVYKDFLENQRYNESIICAGGGKIDTCKGDAGAPLMIKEDGRFYVYGFPVRGNRGNCVLEFHHPNINTNVVYYMDWIKKNAFTKL